MPERPPSLTLDEILAQLPPIDYSCLQEFEPKEPECTCTLKENKTDFSIEEDPVESELQPPCRYEFVEDEGCPAKINYARKYLLGQVDDCRVHQMSHNILPNVNGNLINGPNDEIVEKDDRDLYLNVVPNVYSECKLKGDLPKENYKKYSISEGGQPPGDASETRTKWESFAEWHECIERPSYNGERLKILPYVVID